MFYIFLSPVKPAKKLTGFAKIWAWGLSGIWLLYCVEPDGLRIFGLGLGSGFAKLGL